MTELIKTLMPGSVEFLWAAAAGGAALLFAGPRARRVGRNALALVAVLYLVLSVPAVADGIVDAMSRGYHQVASTTEARGARVVVVLGNGIQLRRASQTRLDVLDLPTAYNVIEAARLYMLLGEPLVVASGGRSGNLDEVTNSSIMRASFVELGVRPERIVEEPDSMTTHEQVELVGRLLRARHVDTFVLVTSPEHIWRAARSFERAGFHPIPSPSRLRYGRRLPGSTPWPNRNALQGSEAAIYELFAIVWYRLRSWM